MKPTFRFKLNAQTFKLLLEGTARNHPNLPMNKLPEFIIENLLALIYSLYQPQDIIFRAIQQPSTSGFMAYSINFTKIEADYFIKHYKESVYRYGDQSLDFIFKKLLFQHHTGFLQSSTKPN